MQNVDELDLPTLDVENPEFWKEPFLPFNDLRAKHPWLAKCSFAYVVTSYDAMREVMEHDDKMSVGYTRAVEGMGAIDTPWGQFIAHAIQNQTGTCTSGCEARLLQHSHHAKPIATAGSCASRCRGF